MAEHNEVGELIGRTVELAASYASNPNVNLSAEELQSLVRETFATLTGLAGTQSRKQDRETGQRRTRLEARDSITADALISFENGRPYKILKRHLASRGLTPASYREKHGLPPDYPMVAPNYSAARSRLAKDLRLAERGLHSAASRRPVPPST